MTATTTSCGLQKVAERLKNHIRENRIKPDAKIFPITYSGARLIVKKAGDLVSVHAKPHDLRRGGALLMKLPRV